MRYLHSDISKASPGYQNRPSNDRARITQNAPRSARQDRDLLATLAREDDAAEYLFAARIYGLCNIKSNKSTSFHPRSDGQTECVNQVLEQYLQVFCDFQQDDWFDILPLAEFTYNNTQHASTQVSPFFANYGFNPRCQLKVLNDRRIPVHPIADGFIEKHRAIYKCVKDILQHAQAKYKEFYNAKHKESPPFKVGDLVWLSRRNITRTSRPLSKLDCKRLSAFKILKVVRESKLAFKLGPTD
jgi:hypothetical protein